MLTYICHRLNCFHNNDTSSMHAQRNTLFSSRTLVYIISHANAGKLVDKIILGSVFFRRQKEVYKQ